MVRGPDGTLVKVPHVRGDPPVRAGGVHALDDRGIRECGTPAFTPYFAEGTETSAEPWRAEVYKRGHIYTDDDRPDRMTYQSVREDPLVALKAQVPDTSAEFAPSIYFETSVPDGEGNTALHHAILQRDIGAISDCVEMGADLWEPNGVGKTPLDLAKELGGEVGNLQRQVDENGDVDAAAALQSINEVVELVEQLERRRQYRFFAAHGHLGQLLQFVPAQAAAELLNPTPLAECPVENGPSVQVSACEGLGLRFEKHPAEAAEYAMKIARVLASEDPAARAAAAQALGRLGLAGACFCGVVAPLVKDPEDAVRRTAVKALAAMAAAGAAIDDATHISTMLQDADDDTRRIAKNALDQAGAPFASAACAAIDGKPEAPALASAAAAALASAPRFAGRGVAPEVLAAAVHALAMMGGADGATISSVQGAALGLMGGTAHAEAIAKLFEDEDEPPLVRRAAAGCLVALGLDGTYPEAEKLAPKLVDDALREKEAKWGIEKKRLTEFDGYSDDWEGGLSHPDYYDMLFQTLRNGHIDAAKPMIYLLEPGFKPMWVNEQGQNFMHALAMNKELDVHKSYSVKHGQPVESPGYGWTSEAKMVNLYKHLVQERCNIHIRDNAKHSPLFIAAAENNATITELLLEGQADPNTWDSKRRKPLHAAVAAGCDEPAQLLLKYWPSDRKEGEPGISTFTLAKDDIGCTPLDLGVFRKGLISGETIRMLQEKMQEDQILREGDGTVVERSETAIWKHCLKWSRTWNVKKLRYWVEVASVFCIKQTGDRREQDLKILAKYQEDVRELAPCVEAALPVLGRDPKFVDIDFDNCTINIEKDIAFETRKEPDTSAEFKAGTEEDVRAILEDVATVVKAFKAPMIVEGHTGATDPKAYWGELAKNRAAEICKVMYEFGCTPEMLRPKGCPGGGAFVAVRPAKPKK